jgi:hypothetical protein
MHLTLEDAASESSMSLTLQEPSIASSMSLTLEDRSRYAPSVMGLETNPSPPAPVPASGPLSNTPTSRDSDTLVGDDVASDNGSHASSVTVRPGASSGSHSTTPVSLQLLFLLSLSHDNCHLRTMYHFSIFLVRLIWPFYRPPALPQC